MLEVIIKVNIYLWIQPADDPMDTEIISFFNIRLLILYHLYNNLNDLGHNICGILFDSFWDRLYNL